VINILLYKYFSNQEGLTLIELLIAIFIFLVVITIVSSMLVQSLNVIEPSMRRMSYSQLAELGKREIASYLRMAVTVEEGWDKGFGGPWEFSGYHPVQGKNENPVRVIDYKIELSGRQLIMENEIDGSRVLANNVDNFSIKKNDNNNFSIEIMIRDEDDNLAKKFTRVRSRNLVE